jgi:hypothetical protein
MPGASSSAVSGSGNYYWLMDKQYDDKDEAALLDLVQEKIRQQAKQSMMRVRVRHHILPSSISHVL